MSFDEHLHARWRVWRHARHADLTHPYGWSAPIAQHWLPDGSTDIALPDLPGRWSAHHGEVTYTPDPAAITGNTAIDAATAPPLTVQGAPITRPTVIENGRYLMSGHPEAQLILSGEREVETIVRRTPSGGNIYAVRVRDPRSAATAETLPITSYDYDDAWRIPAHFEPHAATEVVRETLAEGVIDIVRSIGTLSFTLGEGLAPQQLVVFGTPDRAFTHFRDATSGAETHGNGRMIELDITDITEPTEIIVDWNYAYSMPCSLTPYVSCPVPIAENTLDVAVTAGERLR